MHFPIKLISIFLVFTSLEETAFSEFRFCFHGPHKMSYADCPGGITFRKPVPINCAFFVKSDRIGDGRVSINGDICDGGILEDAEVSQAQSTHTFGLQKIQEVSVDLDPTPTPGTDPATQDECVNSCFGAWMDPDLIPQERGNGAHNHIDIEPTYVYPKLTPDQQEEQAKITEQLFMKLILDDFGNQAGELRVTRLLRASFIVMSTHCPDPYITQSFISKTLDAFLFFSKNSNKPVKDVGVIEFNQLMNSLAQCRTFDIYNSFRVIGKECSDFPEIVGGEISFPNGTTKKYTFTGQALKLDPFIESSWQAVSFINAHCFKHDSPELDMNHVYEVAMEALFSQYILLRWTNPPQLRNVNFWNNLMGTKNFQVEIQNVNTCVKLAYVMSKYEQRMERPFKRLETVGGRSVSEMVSGDGWKKSEPEYWDMYQGKGGFKSVVASLGGTCFANEFERENSKAELAAACPPVT